MRFADAVGRLSPLPDRLPPPPRTLIPLLLPRPDGPWPDTPPLPTGPRRAAAVLVLIHPAGGLAGDEARVVLTERSAGGLRHAGQVSFPGGAVEPADESVVAAALREAREEVGLDVGQAGVRVIGSLRPIDVRVSGFLAHPVIALADRPPLLTADPREVAAVFSAPLAAFLPGAPIEPVIAERDGMTLSYGAYRVGDFLVWGATAMMLGGLGQLLDESGMRPRPNEVSR